MPVFLAIQKCFHVGVGRHNLECLINPAINQSGEVTMGVAGLQSERCTWPVSMQTDWRSSHRGDGHRDAGEGSSLGKGTQKKSQGVKMGWLVDYFIQSTDIFFE